MKRVSLSLTGKSASIILDDADFDTAIALAVNAAFMNYVRPNVFAHGSNDMDIACEQIFGPVLSIIAYDADRKAQTGAVRGESCAQPSVMLTSILLRVALE